MSGSISPLPHTSSYVQLNKRATVFKEVNLHDFTEKLCIHFVTLLLEEKYHFQNLGMERRIILKWSLRKSVVGCRYGWTPDSEQRQALVNMNEISWLSDC
jgi:hypothetical protein